MTSSQRSRHIIPVYLEKPAGNRLVGIPGTTGMVDLSDIWRQIRSSGEVSAGSKAAIRNRLVLPLLEKIDTTFQDV